MAKRISYSQITAEELISDTARDGWRGFRSTEHEFFARKGEVFVRIEGILIRKDGVMFQAADCSFMPAENDVMAVWTRDDAPIDDSRR